jgi:hypothetical protein
MYANLSLKKYQVVEKEITKTFLPLAIEVLTTISHL